MISDTASRVSVLGDDLGGYDALVRHDILVECLDTVHQVSSWAAPGDVLAADTEIRLVIDKPDRLGGNPPTHTRGRIDKRRKHTRWPSVVCTLKDNRCVVNRLTHGTSPSIEMPNRPLVRIRSAIGGSNSGVGRIVKDHHARPEPPDVQQLQTAPVAGGP